MADQTHTQERPRAVEPNPGATHEMTQQWMDVHQRIMRDWTELSASAVREAARAYADTLQSRLDLLRETQASVVRWNPFWPETFSDPMHWYQRALSDTFDGAQRAFQAMTATARVAMESSERLQRTAEQTGRRMQETLGSAAQKARDSGRRAA